MPSGASTARSARDRLGNLRWTAAVEAVSAPSKPPRAGALRRFRLSCASVGCRFPLGSPVNPAGLPAGSRSSFGAKGKRPPGSCLACRRTPAGCQTSVLTPAGIWPTVWHPSRMRTDRPLGTGGRSPCSAPGTTTGYRLPTLPGWVPAWAVRAAASSDPCQRKRNRLWGMLSPKGEGRVPECATGFLRQPSTRAYRDTATGAPTSVGLK